MGFIQKLQTKHQNNTFVQFISELVRRIGEDEVIQAGATLAYYLFLSMFPFLIFLLSVLSFTPLIQSNLMTDLLAILPDSASDIVGPILEDLVNSRSGAVLSFSLLLALWSGSNAMMQAMKLMNRAFDIDEHRSFFVKRALAVVFTLLLATMIIAVMVGPIFGDALLRFIFQFIGENPIISTAWGWIRQLIPLGILILGFMVIYRYAPGFKKENRIRFKAALFGAIFASVGWLLASWAFSIYVNNFANYANTYGSLGGVIVLLVWLYLSSIIFLLGAHIAATHVIITNRGASAEEKDITIYEYIRQYNKANRIRN